MMCLFLHRITLHQEPKSIVNLDSKRWATTICEHWHWVVFVSSWWKPWRPAGSAMTSAMLWIFLLYGAHKRLLAQCKAAYWSSLLFTAFSLECRPAVQWQGSVVEKREEEWCLWQEELLRRPLTLRTAHSAQSSKGKARQELLSMKMEETVAS